MSQFSVTPAQLRTRASELRDENKQFQSKVDELQTYETSLSGMWEGESRDAFHTAFTNDKTQFDNFYNLIEQYCQALETIAQEYELKEKMNVEIASTRS